MLPVAVNDVEVAIAVVSGGADQVRRRFGMLMGRVEKGAGDFATDADIQAENAMLSVLARERPDDGVVAEESGRTGASDALRTWLLDPLCGTRNYAANMRVVAVNAALTSPRGVLAAAVADPFSDEVFWSDNHSSYVRVGGQDTPLAPSADSRLVDLNLDPPFPSAPVFRAADLAGDVEFLESFSPRAVSSSLALTWVASGQRAAYITDGNMRHSVHFSAGLAICQASGCQLTDLHGHPLGTTPTGLIVAADQETHATLLRIVTPSAR
jgi:myo-inositol-1(or 4)-monophosphatase